VWLAGRWARTHAAFPLSLLLPPHCSENEANAAYHRSTTAAEILSDFAGRRLDYFVGGWGTGGTIVGVGEMLRLAVRRRGREGRVSQPDEQRGSP